MSLPAPRGEGWIAYKRHRVSEENELCLLTNYGSGSEAGLLTLKEELSDEGELRQKAEDFLDGLERKLEGSDSRPDPRPAISDRLDSVLAKMEQAVAEARRESRKSASRQVRDSPSYEELEAAWTSS